MQVSSKEVLWSNGKWISPQQAIFPDTRCSGDVLLTSALLANDVPLVTDMPRHVMEGFLQYASGITILTPELARSLLSRQQHNICLTGKPGGYRDIML